MGVIGQDSAQSLWLGLRNRPIEELLPLVAIAIGLLLGLISLVVYIAAGYSRGMLRLWLAALAVSPSPSGRARGPCRGSRSPTSASPAA